jgi:hypothetical protein
LAVTCSPLAAGQATLADPVLLIEILSPSNQAKTWTNVWAYTSIPSVQEFLVLRTDRMAAELLRRSPQGEWPERPIASTAGELALESIGFRVALAGLYGAPVSGADWRRNSSASQSTKFQSSIALSVQVFIFEIFEENVLLYC